jgi:ACT domain-containing protein
MSETDLEQITRAVARMVGDRLKGADAGMIEVVVREVVGAMSGARPAPPRSTPDAPGGGVPAPAPAPEPAVTGGRNRAVVTTTGANKKGVLAAIAGQVAEAGGDIQDVSQTIVSGYFTMIMVVDISELSLPFDQFKDQLVEGARQQGVHAVVVHENVLQALQRV